ncbi:Putative Holin-X, holin superfamily III [Streptomyces prasinopilosus]|uniref:Putative Holin-X, holin superfamily III n=1 Tax=Streptomyces prasinopilosus TaxID=67344 RepID=A0A1G6KF09_9ACTN|nr:Putative Holin-X, holin superfamily III [Streptomyces prasinopilosus]
MLSGIGAVRSGYSNNPTERRRNTVSATIEQPPVRDTRSREGHGRAGYGHAEHGRDEHSVGELVGQATEQVSRLVRQEVALAKVELAEKGRRAGRGGGMLGAAGAFAYAGLLATAFTVGAALSLVLPVWAAALIVTAVLFVVAAVLAALGRAELKKATPAAPEQALDSVKADVEEIKGRAHR